MTWAYYNELDAGKAAWLRELIKANVIAPGEVDERSITDVRAEDLRGFRQCHFFAGIGVWSYALRLAGWPDDREVWTGSCPCPSFSAAGKGEGFGDARHLWPDWFRFIGECRPAVVFGEQVEAAIGHGWLDLVQTDMESAAYAVGSAVLTAAGVGAPHIRARLYFVANASSERRIGESVRLRPEESRWDKSEVPKASGSGATSFVAHAECSRSRSIAGGQTAGEHRGRQPLLSARSEQCGATRGFWSDCDWWYGRDGKWRPIKPGVQPLAHGASARVLRLRGYGDCIVAPLATEFIEAAREAIEEKTP